MLLRLLYSLGVQAYGLAIRLLASFRPKAKKWMEGRKGWKEDWRNLGHINQKIIWFHCASLGEYEQGRPLMERIKKEFPHTFLLVSFFSPSGYEVVRSSSLPDALRYLPLDSPSNMKKLLSFFQPTLLILVKYEFWLNWLREVHHHGIPLVIIAARIERGHPAFGALLGRLYRPVLKQARQIFTQTETSARFLARQLGDSRVRAGRDTRFDRVKASRSEFRKLPEIEVLTHGKMTWIGGSTYAKDEEMILEAYEACRQNHDLCLILAPHETDHNRIDTWIERFPKVSKKYSEWDRKSTCAILWIDRIGMLSAIYAYGDLAFVGGGWNHGLHNILEAATFGCPVLFGPNYQNFPEALDLLKMETAFSYRDQEGLAGYLQLLLKDDQLREEISRKNRNYIDTQSGGSEQIYHYLLQSRLLP